MPRRNNRRTITGHDAQRLRELEAQSAAANQARTALAAQRARNGGLSPADAAALRTAEQQFAQAVADRVGICRRYA